MRDSARSAHEQKLMRRALELARKGWGQTAPNPMVGAVVVRDGAIVGEGFHARYGEAHAEVGAMGSAGAQARGATLYVTLEPCRHYGKTPPCTNAIIGTGIARVVFGASYPTAVAGGGADVLRAAGIEVEGGLLAAESRELNAPFFHAVAGDVPWVTLKLAVSIETAIAGARGTTSWLTSAESRRVVHEMRAGNDAIAVGVGTILADNPQLTVRDAAPPRVPLKRVVFDRRLRTPASAAVVRTARETPTIVVTTKASGRAADALRKAGVEIVEASGLRHGLQQLRKAGIRSLLVEGGATFASAVLAEELAHRLVIFQAPVALGPQALHAFDGAQSRVLGALEQYPVLDRRALGPDMMTTYAIKELG
jgi:diaminohydroxyphosphoribosylaminopyrimidine deaminase/5-amino-6-(5-phosphoribosylamino)uracil reductase